MAESRSHKAEHRTVAQCVVCQTAPWHTARINDGDAIDGAVLTECDERIERPLVVESYPGLPLCDNCSYLRLVRADNPGDNAFLRFLADFEGPHE